MAKININSAPGTGGGGGGGNLQLLNGAAMDAILRAVADTANTASPLKLSTLLVQILSTLKITTDNDPYIDAEDSSGNNRFTVGRPTGSQQVNVDFASNPTGSTTAVGAFRTYKDGVNLSEVMTILEDGTIGVGTTTPDASTLIDMSSTTKGFLPPRMTNAQRAAITSPAEGLLLFNTTNKGVAYRDGTNWGYLSGAIQTVAASGGTVNVSFANGNIIDMTLTASTTLTLSAHVVGTYIFELIQGGTGSYTITWPASVKWSGGTAPTLTTTVGKTDIITLFHDGTNFFGTYSLNY